MSIPPQDVKEVERAENRSKDFQVSRLLANLGEEGCPICRETSGNDERYFFWFFHENYGTAETLDSLTRSLGFCAAHGAQAVLNPGGQSSLAAVHEVLARRMGPILSREASNRTRGKDTGSVLAAIDRCPACRNREEGIARAASFLAAGLNAPDGTDRYGHPGLLCFPHLQTIAPRLREPILVHILKLHESAVASVMESLRNGLDITLLRALRLVAEDDKRPDLYPTDRISETSRIIRDPVGDFLRMLSDESACPVCLEARRAWAEWMQWLKEAIPRGWEVNDLLPTCPEHVRATVRLGDYSLASLTVRKALAAVLDLCCLAIDALATSPVPERGRTLHRFVLSIRGSNPRLREARHVIARTLPCPVCNRLAVARDRILALLFALLETPHHRSAYDRGYGLCLKHFSRAMALRPPTIARAILTDVEAAKLDLLQWELEESLRKDAWSNRPEAPGAEHTAWRRAIERFSGSFAGGDG